MLQTEELGHSWNSMVARGKAYGRRVACSFGRPQGEHGGLPGQ
jgi:hypothetical protein